MGLFSKKKKVEETPAPKAAPAPEKPVGIPAEIVAAISGAIAVIMGENAKITEIKPVLKRGAVAGRTAWNLAGLLENTQPF